MDVYKKDVFELEGVPAFREYYTLFIFIWQAIYKGFYKAWHEVNMHTVKDPKGKTRIMSTMNAGKMACSQMARYVWNERCSIAVSMKNATEEDPLNAYLQQVLKDNRFGTAFGDFLEKAFALGGGALKEWVEIPKDKDGNDIGEGKVRLGYTMASQFVPTAWDNSKVKAGIFINREARDGYYYTVVEWHRLDGTTYRVTNDLYRMPIKGTEPQNILGWWYPLDKVYPLLSPDTTIEDVENAFFQYVRPFGANYADDNSPLGMSIYAPAMSTLHGLDVMFDSLQREFVLGKKRIIAPARAMKAAVQNGGKPERYFDASDEVWEALATDNPEDLKIYDNSVDLRVNEHITGINGDLSILCAQVGFDPGTLSFDASRGLKTATEVISENSKTFGTVKAHENIIKDSLEQMVKAILELAAHYDLTFEGRKVSELISGGYDIAITFDDSIIEDKNAEINQGIALTGAGLMSKKRFLMDVLGMTEEEAGKELAQIGEERKSNAVEVTRLFGGME
ncbi:MAG: phage portal protein [Oscillospiraceae bacterium]|nr:phage portal protein [Oscillospiraceae bacterium]